MPGGCILFGLPAWKASCGFVLTRVFGVFAVPPFPPPNPPRDFAPNANVNTVMATSTAFIIPSKAPSNPTLLNMFLVPS